MLTFITILLLNSSANNRGFHAESTFTFLVYFSKHVKERNTLFIADQIYTKT